MPLIHESTDLLNCDINLSQLQHMDDDEDYVEHDLDDSDNSDDEDDEDDDDSDGFDVEDDEEDDEGDDDDEDEEEDSESEDPNGFAQKLSKTGKTKSKGKSKSSKRGKMKSKKGMGRKKGACLGGEGANKQAGGFDNARSVINEQNFVTIAQKDELTSQIQNGNLFFGGF
jgi:hypothetical protein